VLLSPVNRQLIGFLLFLPRYRHYAALSEGNIYVLGGDTWSRDDNLMIIPTFNLKQGTWRMLNTKPSQFDCPLLFPKKCYGSVQKGEGN